MREKLKIFFKECITKLLNNKKIKIDDKLSMGFDIVNFIVQKESVIKKEHVSENVENIIFDIDENRSILKTINWFADRIRKQLKVPYYSDNEVNLSGGDFLDDNYIIKLKSDLQIIHQLRNEIAHEHYKISKNCIITDDKLKCKIPFKDIRKFNSILAKNYILNFDVDPNKDNTINMAAIFSLHDKLDDYNYNSVEFLYMALYIYMCLVFAHYDSANSFKDIKTGMFELYSLDPKHQCKKEIDHINDDVNFIKDDIDKIVFDKTIYDVDRIKSDIHSIQHSCDRHIRAKGDGVLRSVRNACLHLNCEIDKDMNIILFDKTNQADNTSISFNAKVQFEDLFNFTRAIHEADNIENENYRYQEICAALDTTIIDKLYKCDNIIADAVRIDDFGILQVIEINENTSRLNKMIDSIYELAEFITDSSDDEVIEIIENFIMNLNDFNNGVIAKIYDTYLVFETDCSDIEYMADLSLYGVDINLLLNQVETTRNIVEKFRDVENILNEVKATLIKLRDFINRYSYCEEITEFLLSSSELTEMEEPVKLEKKYYFNN